jgi:hypothetical protein
VSARVALCGRHLRVHRALGEALSSLAAARALLSAADGQGMRELMDAARGDLRAADRAVVTYTLGAECPACERERAVAASQHRLPYPPTYPPTAEGAR